MFWWTSKKTAPSKCCPNFSKVNFKIHSNKYLKNLRSYKKSRKYSKEHRHCLKQSKTSSDRFSFPCAKTMMNYVIGSSRSSYWTKIFNESNCRKFNFLVNWLSLKNRCRAFSKNFRCFENISLIKSKGYQPASKKLSGANNKSFLSSSLTYSYNLSKTSKISSMTKLSRMALKTFNWALQTVIFAALWATRMLR